MRSSGTSLPLDRRARFPTRSCSASTPPTLTLGRSSDDERAAARPRRLRAARLGDLRDRPRRPLDLARAGPARRVPDSRPARAWQGSAALRARPRAVARARARRPRDRGDDARGSRVGRRVRAGRQDRLDRDPRAGLDRAPRLRAERRLRPLGVRPVPRVRARGAVHLGLGRARTAVHASPTLATPCCGDSPRCSSSTLARAARGSRVVALRGGITVFASDIVASRRFYGEQLGLTLDRGRGRVLGEARRGRAAASRAERARRRLSREFYEEAGVLVRLETDTFDSFLGGIVSRGVKLFSEVKDSDEGRFVGFVDPDGNLFELIESVRLADGVGSPRPRAPGRGCACACPRPDRATRSSRGSCGATACTPSARRPAARTSASASAAAPRRSRSWATPARVPAATAPSSRASTAIRSTRSSRARSPRPPRAWACSHVVVTSVDRDDLPDRGAEHWAQDRARAAPQAARRDRRGADAGLPRLRGGGARDAARGRARRVQPQHRDLPAHPAAGAHQGRLRAGALRCCAARARCGTSAFPSGARC